MNQNLRMVRHQGYIVPTDRKEEGKRQHLSRAGLISPSTSKVRCIEEVYMYLMNPDYYFIPVCVYPFLSLQLSQIKQ